LTPKVGFGSLINKNEGASMDVCDKRGGTSTIKGMDVFYEKGKDVYDKRHGRLCTIQA
jgi:hypothetical protein